MIPVGIGNRRAKRPPVNRIKMGVSLQTMSRKGSGPSSVTAADALIKRSAARRGGLWRASGSTYGRARWYGI
jgi:hypothetical protein